MNSIKRFFVVVLCLSTLVFSESALSQDNSPVKNGWPCLREVCLGDDISKLKGIKWEAVDTRGAVRLNIGREWNDRVIAVPYVKKMVTPYIALRAFDGKAIAALSQAAVCDDRFLFLTGKYKSRSGQETEVAIEPFPSEDGSSQRFLVTHVRRIFSGNFTEEQMNDLRNKVDALYKGVEKFQLMSNNRLPRYELPEPYKKELNFYFPEHDVLKKRNDLLKYPGCNSRPILD